AQPLTAYDHPTITAIGRAEVGVERRVVRPCPEPGCKNTGEGATGPESLYPPHHSSHPFIAQGLGVDRDESADSVDLEVISWIVSECHPLPDVDTAHVHYYTCVSSEAHVRLLERVDGLRGGTSSGNLVKPIGEDSTPTACQCGITPETEGSPAAGTGRRII